MSHVKLFTSVIAAGVLGAAAAADIHLEYLGANDLGDGTWLHAYEGVRDAGDFTDVRDLHIEGRFVFDPGTISLTAPGDWSTTVYTGPGPFLFNWQINEGQVWSNGSLTGFGIVVDTPVVTSTPFNWTNNSQLPELPDLGQVVGSGTTFVPVPSPGAWVLVGLGGVLAARRRR